MKIKTIEVVASTQFVEVKVDGKLDARFPFNGPADRSFAIKQAKVAAFEVAVELTELGNEIAVTFRNTLYEKV